MNNILTNTSLKSEVILMMAYAAYRPGGSDADAQAKLRRGFESIVDELRRIEAIPKADIDEFVAASKAGAEVEQLMIHAVLFANMLPDIDYFAALVDAGFGDDEEITRGSPIVGNKKFMDASRALLELRDKHGDEGIASTEGDELFMQMLENAPPEFMEILHEEATELGLLPEAKYVNDAGEPVYSAQQIAEKFDVPIAKVERDIKRLFPDRMPVGNVHPLQ
ncbi:hypothetical protein G7048_15525 [Diaphorobacter sp. HDW4B]|uniref:hypothetical protein n=1 Tax=Diaphorobacter sp. HDW4B TaxID=2714925 RepID=UPI001408F1E4|nr:hypothetical protein [Diaphorobacter sp. HDW4B]QIL71639.1 hypothetical protein G7048_15525 [Diaphorobacter sp. HDW4B]